MSLELENARQQLAEQVVTCQQRLQDAALRLELEVDPVGLPTAVAPLRDFSRQGLAVVVAALAEAAGERHSTDAISKVLVRYDEGAATSRFDFDPSKRLLVIIATPKLERWVDFLALKDFLNHEVR